MRAQDTLHLKVAFDASLENPLMAKFFEAWIKRDPMAKRSMPSNRNGTPWSGARICDDFRHTLSATENWFVGAQTMDAVSSLAETMPPEVLQREDLPSTHGWLIFEKPWILHDVHMNRMPIRGILWSQRMVGKDNLGQSETPGIVIWCLIDVNDNAVEEYWRYGATDKEVVKRLVKGGMRLTPATNFAVGFDSFAFELADTRGVYLMEDNDGVRIEKDKEPGVWRVWRGIKQTSEMTLVHEDDSDNPDQARIRRFHKAEAEALAREPSQRVRPEPIIQFLQALWRFQATKMAAIERDHLRKTTEKLLVRRQMIPNPVSIILLRQRQSSGQGATGVHYQLSHQFWVRAHWRRQWYPSEGRHKSIPIAPFHKGPENAPWLVRQRVNAVVR